MTELNDPLSMVNFDEEELKKTEQMYRMTPRGKVDLRVCACGHAVSRHKKNIFSREAETYVCAMPNGTCPCKVVKPTLAVRSTKPFVLKTLGPGVAHALIRGIMRVKERSEEDYRAIEWLVPFKCEKCDKEDVKISPVNMGFDGAFTEEGNAVTVLICDDCRFPSAPNL
jgi:hypothetical protein